MIYTFDQISNPEAHGLQICSHCDGYGSSLKDPDGVDRCTRCDGAGIVPIEKPAATTQAKRVINWQ